MSGIVALHGPVDPALGPRMLERLAHRGPDGCGARAVGADAWLGHQRLAIVDVAGGAQPLGDEASGLWLVGDGEIHNHDRLREELGTERLRSRSDHEVARALYDRDGVAAFERLWGVFALAMAAEDGRFVAARDTLGVAPLYWARRDGATAFASELKAFDEAWRGDVEPFPPGHAWTPAGGLQPWRPFPAAAPVLLQGRTGEEPPDWVFAALRDAVVRAVEHMMIADVPVGVLLSGGLDSSIVTAIAAQAAARTGTRVPTFAAGLAGSPDLAAARLVAEHAGTEHREEVYRARDAIALVPEVIEMLESFDPQLVHSAVPNHLVARLACRHVKAVLIGEGADELFAGYEHFGRHDHGDALHGELVDTLGGMHVGGLRRADRVTSSSALEARIPFLDLDVVQLAMALPPEWKLVRDDRPAKWLLRRAFEGWLPEEVLWRPKEQFGQGTGMNDVLREHFEATVSAAEFEHERDTIAPPLRTREELAYHRIFVRRLPGLRAQTTVGRFAEA
jgi:asparagine synthase (glutamine-hydrolysing)